MIASETYGWVRIQKKGPRVILETSKYRKLSLEFLALLASFQTGAYKSFRLRFGGLRVT